MSLWISAAALLIGWQAPADARPRTYAVFIGAGAPSGLLEALPGAAADARSLRRIFYDRGLVPADQLLLSTDDLPAAERPTRGMIFDGAVAHLKQARAQDRVVFFFAGHGLRDEATGRNFLVPVDADIKKPLETCVPFDELLQRLGALSCRDKVVIVDACHSGTVPGLTRDDVERE
ncbi:MAG: caspase family protein, partial [Planctomycetia bacterium]